MAHKITKKEAKEEIGIVRALGAMLDFQTNAIAQLSKDQEKMMKEKD